MQLAINPIRKRIPIQIVGFVTVSQNACPSELGETFTTPICVIPRFSIRSPALAHTTIARTMTSVLIRSLRSLAMSIYFVVRLVVARNRRSPRHGDNRLVDIAALPYPLPTFRAQLQKACRLVVQALPVVAVPQPFTHY